MAAGYRWHCWCVCLHTSSHHLSVRVSFWTHPSGLRRPAAFRIRPLELTYLLNLMLVSSATLQASDVRTEDEASAFTRRQRFVSVGVGSWLLNVSNQGVGIKHSGEAIHTEMSSLLSSSVHASAEARWDGRLCRSLQASVCRRTRSQTPSGCRVWTTRRPWWLFPRPPPLSVEALPPQPSWTAAAPGNSAVISPPRLLQRNTFVRRAWIRIRIREVREDEFSICLGYSKDAALINDWFHHAPPSAQPASIFI